VQVAERSFIDKTEKAFVMQQVQACARYAIEIPTSWLCDLRNALLAAMSSDIGCGTPLAMDIYRHSTPFINLAQAFRLNDIWSADKTLRVSNTLSNNAFGVIFIPKTLKVDPLPNRIHAHLRRTARRIGITVPCPKKFSILDERTRTKQHLRAFGLCPVRTTVENKDGDVKMNLLQYHAYTLLHENDDDDNKDGGQKNLAGREKKRTQRTAKPENGKHASARGPGSSSSFSTTIVRDSASIFACTMKKFLHMWGESDDITFERALFLAIACETLHEGLTRDIHRIDILFERCHELVEKYDLSDFIMNEKNDIREMHDGVSDEFIFRRSFVVRIVFRCRAFCLPFAKDSILARLCTLFLEHLKLKHRIRCDEIQKWVPVKSRNMLHALVEKVLEIQPPCVMMIHETVRRSSKPKPNPKPNDNDKEKEQKKEEEEEEEDEEEKEEEQEQEFETIACLVCILEQKEQAL
jgi:hypothetical protein